MKVFAGEEVVSQASNTCVLILAFFGPDSQMIMACRWIRHQFLVLSGVLVYNAGSTVACISSIPQQLRASPGIDRTLESPGYPSGYQNDLECFWRITATDGYVVKLTSIYVDVEYAAECDKDYISIHDGNSSNSMVLGEYCNDWCMPVVSSGRHMFVRFITDCNITDDGFQLSYTAIPPLTTGSQNTPSLAPDQNIAVTATPNKGDNNLEVAIIATVAAVVCVFGVLLTVCCVAKINKSSRVSAVPAAATGGRTRAGRRVREDFVEYDNTSVFLVGASLPPYSSSPPPAYTAVPAVPGAVEASAPSAPDADTSDAAPAGANSGDPAPSQLSDDVMAPSPPHTAQ